MPNLATVNLLPVQPPTRPEAISPRRAGACRRPWMALLLVLAGLGYPVYAQQQEDPFFANQWVGSIAGARQWAGVGDRATETSLPVAGDFTFAPDGTLIATAPELHQLVRIAPDGVVRTYAGTGQATSSGNGGTKELASFHFPRTLAFDQQANLYVAENGYIRRIRSSGVVEAVAGNGEQLCPASGGPLSGRIGNVTRMVVGSNNHLFFLACNALYRLGPSGFELALEPGASDPSSLQSVPLELPASQWKSGRIEDIDVHSNGDIYIADSGLQQVYVLTSQGNIRRIAGVFPSFDPQETRALYVRPPNMTAIRVQPNGDTLVTDSNVVIGVVRTNGSYGPLAPLPYAVRSDGVSGYSLPLPITGFRSAPDGGLFVRASAGMVFRFSADPALDLVLGYMQLPSTDLSVPAVLSRLNITAYAADTHGNVVVGGLYPNEQSGRIYRISPTGEVSHLAGNGQEMTEDVTGPARERAILWPFHLDVGPDGSVYFTGSFGPGMLRVLPNGMLDSVMGFGLGNPGFDLTGKVAKNLNFRVGALGDSPSGFVLTPAGEVLFRSTLRTPFPRRQFIWKMGLDGIISLVAGGGGEHTVDPDGQPALTVSAANFPLLLIDPSGTVYFAHQRSQDRSNRLFRIDASGIARHFAGSGGAEATTSGALPTATSLANCSVLEFHGPGDLLCSIFGGGQVLRIRSAEAVSPAVRNGRYVFNNGGRWGDDAGAVGLMRRRVPTGGVVAVSVSAERYTVRRTWQVPPGCTYGVSSQSLNVPAMGGEATVTLQTGSGCPWTAGTTNFWLSLAERTFGSGSTTLTLRAKANPSRESRISTLAVGGYRIAVTQPGATGPTPEITVTPATIQFLAAGGDALATITVPGGVAWTAVSPASWVQLPIATTGASGTALVVRAAPNNTNSARSATVAISAVGATPTVLTVQQAAASSSQTPTPKMNALVEGAGFRSLPVAPGSIASLFGEHLSASVAAAQSTPLPTTLGGMRLRFRVGSVTHDAGLFFASPTQVNLLVPETLPTGPAILELLQGPQVATTLAVTVSSVAPSLFAANADGKGAPAGYTIAVRNGVQTRGEVAACPPQQTCTPIPVNYVHPDAEVFLILFGTGFRGNATLPEVNLGGIPAEVVYAGPQGSFAGLDQLNIRIPNAVRGLGLLEISVRHANQHANLLLGHF